MDCGYRKLTTASPDTDSAEDMLQIGGIFTMKSPISALAHDMDANLHLFKEFLLLITGKTSKLQREPFSKTWKVHYSNLEY
jgi:hypothetical protein